MARRHTRMGRKKIRIRRIESERARRFSKCRAKVFKKAVNLALRGADVAAIAISPAGKAFSFGHPTVESVLERFAPTRAGPTGGGAGAGEHNMQLADLYQQYRELRAALDAAEKVRDERADAVKERAAGSRMAAWMEADIRDIEEDELMEFYAALLKVQEQCDREKVDRDAMQARARPSNDNQLQMMMAMTPPPPGFAVAGMETLQQQQQEFGGFPGSY